MFECTQTDGKLYFYQTKYVGDICQLCIFEVPIIFKNYINLFMVKNMDINNRKYFNK